MQHLRSLMDLTEPSFAKIHNFLFDRYRSVRQDLYVQGFEARRSFASVCSPGILSLTFLAHEMSASLHAALGFEVLHICPRGWCT